MERPFLLAALFFAALVAIPGLNPVAGPADIYQWTDKNGNVCFSDRVPEGVDARKVRANRFDHAARKEEPEKNILPPQPAPIGSASDGRIDREVKAIMYMTTWCPYCRKARDYIKSLGIPFTEYDIEKDSARKDEMRRKSGGSTGVPLIDIEGTIIHGYNPDAIREAVDRHKRR